MSAATRFSGSLFDLDGPGFVPAREDVKGNPAAEAARDAKFRVVAIDEARAEKRPGPQPEPLVMGAVHERAPVEERPQVEQSAATVRPAARSKRAPRRSPALDRSSPAYWRCIEKALRILLRSAP